MSGVLEQLEQHLIHRKTAAADKSYVASLYGKGIDVILKKLGEETTETIIAVKSGSKPQVVHEAADLVFHLMVMLTHQDIRWAEVLSELERRSGRSGLEEKAARQP